MLRIAITGPESTGKSTLAAALATHYHTVWVPEFARTYIGNLNRPYTLHDLEAIAAGQLEAEITLARQANRLLFCDTDLFVLKIWAEHAFGHCPSWILEKLNQHPYDLHLLMDIDLPWQPDPQREHPHLREHFIGVYRQNLAEAGVPFHLVSGTETDRLTRAIGILERHFPEKQKGLPESGSPLSG